jgi:hypothetical protein
VGPYPSDLHEIGCRTNGKTRPVVPGTAPRPETANTRNLHVTHAYPDPEGAIRHKENLTGRQAYVHTHGRRPQFSQSNCCKPLRNHTEPGRCLHATVPRRALCHGRLGAFCAGDEQFRERGGRRAKERRREFPLLYTYLLYTHFLIFNTNTNASTVLPMYFGANTNSATSASSTSSTSSTTSTASTSSTSACQLFLYKHTDFDHACSIVVSAN